MPPPSDRRDWTKATASGVTHCESADEKKDEAAKEAEEDAELFILCLLMLLVGLDLDDC